MQALKMIKKIKDSGLFEYDFPTYIGILPNDGKIISGFPQAILTFSETNFNIYPFKGLFRYTYENEVYRFSFSDIKEIEMGKYNFKNRYIKIVFSDDRFIAFDYRFKVKKYPEQKTNLIKFIEKLNTLAQNSSKK